MCRWIKKIKVLCFKAIICCECSRLNKKKSKTRMNDFTLLI